MPQALYSKYRPRRWDSVVGQDHVIQTLRNAVTSQHIVHAYLFAGPRGTGKTTTARLLAKALNCLNSEPSERPCDECDHCQGVNTGRFLDLIEIDAASNTSVDDVRDLRDKINFSPNLGRYKVYVIDEVHMLSKAAFNALLKTLEEPPSHAIFILATTEVHKIPATVLSRCQRHEFRRIPVAEIISTLEKMSKKEGIQISPGALDLIARQSTGSLRDAISLLDQLASTGASIDLDFAQSVIGSATSQSVVDVVGALLTCEIAEGLKHIHQALDSGSDAQQFARQIVDYLRSLLLIQMGGVETSDITPELQDLLKGQAKTIDTPQLLKIIRLFNLAANASRTTWQPALPLEVAFIEACQSQTAPGPTTEPEKSTGSNPSTPNPGNTQPAQIVQPRPERGGDPESAAVESQALNQKWSQALSMVRQERPNLYGLLNSCQSRYLSGSVLTLGFASDILKNQMDKRENLEFIQKVFSRILGSEIDVRCSITAAKTNDIPTEVDDDGMVASAVRDLGGEIVDVQ